jgi:hypothetical protein
VRSQAPPVPPSPLSPPETLAPLAQLGREAPNGLTHPRSQGKLRPAASYAWFVGFNPNRTTSLCHEGGHVFGLMGAMIEWR